MYNCTRPSLAFLFLKSIDLFTTVFSLNFILTHESEQGQEVMDSPGEWLNESEEASDRE